MTRVARGAGPAAIALGFRVKSGYAVAVALRGPASAPAVVARRVVAMSDPAFPETRQPYHDGFYKQEDDPRELARRIGIVKRCAARSIDALLKDEPLGGLTCRRAGLVVGSVIDPKTVGNLHVRAHASEGQLFRTVLSEALRSRGIACDVHVEKTMKKADAGTANTIASFGKALGGPWRAEEKAACAAAWQALT
jgi:hypothetical protein